MGIMKLIHMLKELIPDCRNSWYADDSAGAGRAVKRCQTLVGSSSRVWPKSWILSSEKTVLIIKDPRKPDDFRSLFPGIKVTAEGHRYLRFFIGSKSATESYVATKVRNGFKT